MWNNIWYRQQETPVKNHNILEVIFRTIPFVETVQFCLMSGENLSDRYIIFQYELILLKMILSIKKKIFTGLLDNFCLEISLDLKLC